MRVMLGITGASGAPYAARVLRGLVRAGVDVGVCASAAAHQVAALELYGEREPSGDPIARLVSEWGGEGVPVYGERDWSAPHPSGSARTGAVVVWPCPM